MIISVQTFWLLLWIVASVRCLKKPTHKIRTSLAIKRNVTQFHMAIGTKGFRDLVVKNDVLVDNSLFIKQIVNSYDDHVLILCPKRWGKTTNLDMLKTFLEIHADEEGNRILPVNATTVYQLFARGEVVLKNNETQFFHRRLLVGRYLYFIDHNLGQFPVIYVTFKHAFGKNYNMIRQRMQLAISRTFHQHKYMLKVLANGLNGSVFNAQEKINTFKRALYHEKSFEPEITQSLAFLCKILRNHFRSNVYVLIDDYDEPLQSVLQSSDFPKGDIINVLRLIDNILGWTMKRNIFLRKGIVTGTYQMPELKSSHWKDYKLYDITGRTWPILQYFGFKIKDVQYLFDQFNISQDLKESANEWYRGYWASRLASQHYYNPYSIVNFLNHQKIASYWHENGNFDVMNKFLKLSRYYRDEIFTLLSHRPIYTGPRFVLSEDELWTLKTLLQIDDTHENNPFAFVHYGHTELHMNATRLFNAYLLDHGFLSYMFIGSQAKMYMAKMPNNEIAFELSKRMIYYIQQEYQIEQEHLEDAAHALLEFIPARDGNTTRLENALETIYRRSIVNDTQNDTSFGPENADSMIFAGVTLRMQCLSKFLITVYYSSYKHADIVMFNNRTKHAVVVQFQHHQDSPENVLKEAEQFDHIFDQDNPREQPLTVKYVGISVSAAKNVRVLAKTKNRQLFYTTTTIYPPSYESKELSLVSYGSNESVDNDPIEMKPLKQFYSEEAPCGRGFMYQFANPRFSKISYATIIIPMTKPQPPPELSSGSSDEGFQYNSQELDFSTSSEQSEWETVTKRRRYRFDYDDRTYD